MFSSPASETPAPSPPWKLLFGLAAIPILESVLRMGRLHPDEVFQALDPAMNRAFGYGVMAWEWQVGLRNWFVPGTFALLLQLAHGVGIDDVQARRFVLALPQYALHVAMLLAVWRFSQRRIGSNGAGWAVATVALNPLVVFFAGRAMSESFSAAFVVWGLERLDAPESNRRSWPALAAGLLLGLAQVTRYGSAAFIVPVLIVLLVTRRFRAFGGVVVGGMVVAFLLGLLDKLTWGSVLPTARWGGWWHSLQEYVDFNLLSGRSAAQFGASPWYFYGPHLLAPVGLVGMVLWFWDRASRALGWLVIAAAYLVSVSITAHKEERFLYPLLVVVSVAGAPAFVHLALAAAGRVANASSWMRGGWAKGLVVVTVVAACAPSFIRTRFMPERPELFRLTARASREGTGLVVMNEGLWGSGGAFWMNGSNAFFRGADRAPTSTRWWCTCDFPEEGCFQGAAQTSQFNRAILMGPLDEARFERSKRAFEAAGFSLIDRDGEGFYFAR